MDWRSRFAGVLPMCLFLVSGLCQACRLGMDLGVGAPAFVLSADVERKADGMGNNVTAHTTSTISSGILKGYRALHDKCKASYASPEACTEGERKAPKWAWNFRPSIPFVGEQYRPDKGLLIYASAENLTWMNRTNPPARYTSDAALNRYRAAYEEQGRNAASFFPCVGIQPVNDGGLLAAGLYLAERVGLPVRQQPRDFLETIAVSNWCKFTIQSERNVDYLHDTKKLVESLPFVVTELSALRPAFAVLPQTLWRNPVLCAAMRGASPATRFLSLPQFNTTVVNIHLAPYDADARNLRCRMAGTTLGEWTRHLVGFNESNSWRYFACLNALFAHTT